MALAATLCLLRLLANGVGLTATPVTLVWDEEPQCKAPRPALEQPPILCDPMDTLTDNSGGQPA